MKEGTNIIPSQKQHAFQLILTTTLPSNFDPTFWSLIQQTPSLEYLQTQTNILTILLSDEKLFDTFFHRFYSNHEQIYKWYMLANKNKNQIKSYLFKDLVKYPFKHYKEKIVDKYFRDKFFKTSDYNEEKQHNKNVKSIFKKQKNDKFIIKQNKSWHKENVLLNERQIQRNQQKEIQQSEQFKQDYHELFLRTFKACDGSKYIHYNFDKHQQGHNEIKYYNKFIRVKKIKNKHQTMKYKDNQQFIMKSHLYSTINDSPKYFHQNQAQRQQIGYSNYNLTPIGSFKKQITQKQSIVEKIKKNISLVKKKRPNFQFYKTSSLKRQRII